MAVGMVIEWGERPAPTGWGWQAGRERGARYSGSGLSREGNRAVAGCNVFSG